MSESQTIRETLGELLAEAATPIYLVDANREIAFANHATAEWLGLSLEEVLGRQVEYHSESTTTTGAGLLTGLCPSPAALLGEEVVGTLSSVARAGGLLRRRRARFVPLLPGKAGPVLVVAEESDLTAQQLAELVGAGATDSLHAALRRFRSERAAATPLALLGPSLPTQKLRAKFDAAAASGCNALVVGGSAADRRELAEALHDTASSTRQRQESAALIPIEGSLIDDEELAQATARLKRLADPTTVLLLDADALTPGQQQTLARVFIGLSNVRMLATITDADAPLAEELEAVVATVTLPLTPLVERRADLPLLAQAFVEQLNAGSLKQVAGVSEDAIETLLCYPFRDLEQLQGMIAHGHKKGAGPLIQTNDLPAVARQATLAAELSQPVEQIDLDQLIADVEREAVVRALASSNGNRAEAARRLGLTRQRFYRLLERLGLLDGDSSQEAGSS